MGPEWAWARFLAGGGEGLMVRRPFGWFWGRRLCCCRLINYYKVICSAQSEGLVKAIGIKLGVWGQAGALRSECVKNSGILCKSSIYSFCAIWWYVELGTLGKVKRGREWLLVYGISRSALKCRNHFLQNGDYRPGRDIHWMYYCEWWGERGEGRRGWRHSRIGVFSGTINYRLPSQT